MGTGFLVILLPECVSVFLWKISLPELIKMKLLLAVVALCATAIIAAPVEEPNKTRHTVRLRIWNHSHLPMTLATNWFDKGRLKHGSTFPKVINNYGEAEIVMHETDHSFSGCSGYVTYIMGHGTKTSTPVAIAYSNPAAGKNKLDVGTGDAKTIWKKMTSNDYKTFKRSLYIEHVHMVATGTATGGYVNDAQVHFVA